MKIINKPLHIALLFILGFFSLFEKFLRTKNIFDRAEKVQKFELGSIETIKKEVAPCKGNLFF